MCLSTGCLQRGAGLIEISISLLLLSIGVLGLGNLQISGKRIGFQAVQRAEAASLAQDLFERMRGNRAGLDGYAANDLGSADGTQLAEPTRDCANDSCSSGQLSAWDMWQWYSTMNGLTTAAGEGGLFRPFACIGIHQRRVVLEIVWEAHSAPGSRGPDTACGSGQFGQDDEFRQLLRMSSWIGPDLQS